jgi:putative ABC transport system permease protein
VTNSSDLANEVTGSLASASSLANNLGRWLAIAVLVAAFLLASLLTMSAVSRRVREFGTLKALGWRSRRVIGQVMGESIVIGMVGGIVGVGLGFLGATLVSRLFPPLSASIGLDHGHGDTGRRAHVRRRWRRRLRRRRRRVPAAAVRFPAAQGRRCHHT